MIEDLPGFPALHLGGGTAQVIRPYSARIRWDSHLPWVDTPFRQQLQKKNPMSVMWSPCPVPVRIVPTAKTLGWVGANRDFCNEMQGSNHGHRSLVIR